MGCHNELSRKTDLKQMTRYDGSLADISSDQPTDNMLQRISK